MKYLLPALSLVISLPASAYVRSRTNESTAIAWPSQNVTIDIDKSASTDLDVLAVKTGLANSIQHWRDVIGGCSYFQLFPGRSDLNLEARYEKTGTRHVIKFRKSEWCPADAKASSQCYPAAAAAITTVFFIDCGPNSTSNCDKTKDGVIVDADIEMNNVNFTFVNLPSSAQARTDTSLADYENTLTHELGHFMGLDHTCADSSTPPVSVDDNGQRPPDCGNVDKLSIGVRNKIKEATMYNSADQGETKKRTPEADDVNGICTIYPLTELNNCDDGGMSTTDGFCPPFVVPNNSTGCSFGLAASGSAGMLGAFAIVASLFARRRTRKTDGAR